MKVGEEEGRGEIEGENSNNDSGEERRREEGEFLEPPGWYHHSYLRDICNLGI